MQKIIAANWKMYKTRQEARETAAAVAAALNEQPTPHEVVVFAPFTAIADVADAFAASQAQAGAQDVWPAVEGAFTGEISPRMLQDAGAVWVLTGHSERRHVLGESDELVGRKTAFALEQGLKVMLCIGEKLEERESGQLEDVLRRQLDSGLPAGENALEGRFAVAYEPVWAIGTGKVAGPDDMRPEQFNKYTEEIGTLNIKCIFSYDEKQYLSDNEKEYNLKKRIEEELSCTPYILK